MKIGLVGQKLLINNPAGVEKYIYYIFQALAKIDKKNEYIVYVTQKPTAEFWEELSCGNEKFKYKVIPYSKLPLISWTQMQLAWELFKNPVDAVFYPYDTISGLLNWFMPKKFNPTCMIHDLGYLKAKEYKNPIIKLIHYFTIYYTVMFCKKLIVPATEIKNNILKAYPTFGNILYNKEKIKVIPEGLNKYFYENEDKTSNPNKISIKNLRKKYNIENSDYLYFISTIQPRKNIKRMIEGFSKVIKENEKYKDLKLVISGKLGWNYEADINAPKEFGIENNVLFIGRSEDEEIPVLMKNSKALINVSIEEGFGLPALEAMACEIPLILSNIEVFKELAKEYAIYVNPLDTEDIAKGIKQLLNNEYPKEYIKNAKDIANTYTWEETAKKTLDIFKK